MERKNKENVERRDELIYDLKRSIDKINRKVYSMSPHRIRMDKRNQESVINGQTMDESYIQFEDFNGNRSFKHKTHYNSSGKYLDASNQYKVKYINMIPNLIKEAVKNSENVVAKNKEFKINNRS